MSALTTRNGVPEDARALIKSKIDALPESPLNYDVWIYRAVVVILGICVLITVAGGIGLVFAGAGSDKMRLPDSVVAIGLAAIGALAGLLAPSTKKKLISSARDADRAHQRHSQWLEIDHRYFGNSAQFRLDP